MSFVRNVTLNTSLGLIIDIVLTCFELGVAEVVGESVALGVSDRVGGHIKSKNLFNFTLSAFKLKCKRKIDRQIYRQT